MINYQEIALHYKNCLKKHGDTALGLDWPTENDMLRRYDVMLGLIKNYETDLTLLDLGCGTSGLLEYINNKKLNNIHYAGLDINKEFIEISQKKFPSIDYYCSDILSGDINIPNFDYVVMNGIFTLKCSLSFDDMFNFMKEMLRVVSLKANIGFAFNVMSKHVDWERDDLFHLPLDPLVNFLSKGISRNFVIRNNYELYEYTVYVYLDKKTLIDKK
jgi:ubiquinone/menaquinone biosynthesis C-methylase UbiE